MPIDESTARLECTTQANLDFIMEFAISQETNNDVGHMEILRREVKFRRQRAVSSPTDSRQSSTVFDVAKHLGAHGFSGESGGAPSEMVGAEIGIKYYGDGFEVKIFEYADERSAIKFEASGLAKPRFRNGKFIMLVRRGNAERLGSVFQDF